MFAGKFLARIEVLAKILQEALVERDGGLTLISHHPVCICLPDRGDRLSEIERTWWIEDYPVWIDILCSNLEVRSRIGLLILLRDNVVIMQRLRIDVVDGCRYS